jgi:hypothetical protein
MGNKFPDSKPSGISAQLPDNALRFAYQNWAQGVVWVDFPVNFPNIGNLALETGSYMTAHTTTQSSRTAENVLDRKLALSAGILGACFRLSRSLLTLTVSRVDF